MANLSLKAYICSAYHDQIGERQKVRIHVLMLMQPDWEMAVSYQKILLQLKWLSQYEDQFTIHDKKHQLRDYHKGMKIVSVVSKFSDTVCCCIPRPCRSMSSLWCLSQKPCKANCLSNTHLPSENFPSYSLSNSNELTLEHLP